ncbi:MAG: imidazole glycerol phosphate synthase subunit HisH [Acidobacteria bacterium]|nr:imidazole glycerol phosphate synthase subunit HisH [Acidobacteriota bacterium]
MIAIFDYGAGNLRSVENTLSSLGARYQIVRDAAGLRRAAKIILPGVGHFGQMMRALDELGVRGALVERIRAGIPFLGICLGMQALFEMSAEAPEVKGLGLYPGRVERFPQGVRAPHMGWNELELRGSPSLFRGLGARPYVYFAHSYYVPEAVAGERTAALVDYSVRYAAALEGGNVFGVQFHPEKSGPIGQQVVKNFVG